MATAQKVDFAMMRGDTFSFDIVLNDVDPESISSLYFTVKRKDTDSDTDAVIQKSLSNGISKVEGEDIRYRVRVSPEDTENVAAKKYVYDIQIGVTNDIYTLIKGNLSIEQDVTGAIT